MKQLDSIQTQLNYTLNNAMKVLDKGITLIPESKLNFKPESKLKVLSLKNLTFHVYNQAFIYAKGTIQGSFNDETDFDLIPIKSDNIRSTADILDIGKKVKKFIHQALPKISEDQLKQEVQYNFPVLGWGEWKLSGFASLATILEEVIHHRGQLSLYLRILGIKPPFIYDFS